MIRQIQLTVADIPKDSAAEEEGKYQKNGQIHQNDVPPAHVLL
jgi:hypothetical protein